MGGPSDQAAQARKMASTPQTTKFSTTQARSDALIGGIRAMMSKFCTPFEKVSTTIPLSARVVSSTPFYLAADSVYWGVIRQSMGNVASILRLHDSQAEHTENPENDYSTYDSPQDTASTPGDDSSCQCTPDRQPNRQAALGS